MALVALCLWVVAAWLAMVILSARRPWPAAYALAAAGAPVLAWLAVSMSLAWAAFGAVTMALVLRWPLVRLVRRLRVLATGSAGR